MATRKQAKKRHELPEPYASRVAEATRMAHEALKHYGKPTISREELRKRAAEELKGKSLSDLLIEDRQSGY